MREQSAACSTDLMSAICLLQGAVSEYFPAWVGPRKLQQFDSIPQQILTAMTRFVARYGLGDGTALME